MTANDPPRGWRPAQRVLHWLGAVLVLATFALGWWMVAVPLRELLLKFALYQAHKTAGLCVLGVSLARLILRARRGRPAWAAGLSPLARRLAGLGQGVLYALLLGVPVLGYLTAAAAPVGVPTLLFGLLGVPHAIAPDPALFALLRPVHRALAVLLVALAAGHAGMALFHHARGQNVLRPMWRRSGEG